jgi:hypothetical protein
MRRLRLGALGYNLLILVRKLLLQDFNLSRELFVFRPAVRN